MSSVERSDEAFTTWMRDNLDRAATMFGLTVTSEPEFGWRLRSISARAHDNAGHARWLRVGSEQQRWLDESWTGNVDANSITAVPKPRVLDWREWEVADEQRRVRAEVMTLLPGRPCSPTDALRTPIELPETWWAELRHTLTTLRTVPTIRFAGQPAVSRRARDVLGVDIQVERWETVHGDLQWTNLLAPEFGLLDWEMWGRGPAGTDAANLYCMTLLVPEVAAEVHDVFADVLDTPTGRTAQILVTARLLHRAALGDFPDLVAPLRRHAAFLLDTTTT